MKMIEGWIPEKHKLKVWVFDSIILSKFQNDFLKIKEQLIMRKKYVTFSGKLFHWTIYTSVWLTVENLNSSPVNVNCLWNEGDGF